MWKRRADFLDAQFKKALLESATCLLCNSFPATLREGPESMRASTSWQQPPGSSPGEIAEIALTFAKASAVSENVELFLGEPSQDAFPNRIILQYAVGRLGKATFILAPSPSNTME